MQSGTTGINSLRIYNPVKQSREQDPEGTFIRRWVPELDGVSAQWIHEPWRMPESLQRRSGVRIGAQYPRPIVDHAAASRRARQRIAALRRTAGSRREARDIFLRHGSRRPSRIRRVTVTVPK
jgi:deoxyribodipyrimidine photo-lyase